MTATLEAALHRAKILMNYTRQQYAYVLAQELYGSTGVCFLGFNMVTIEGPEKYMLWNVSGYDSSYDEVYYDLTTDFWKTFLSNLSMEDKWPKTKWGEEDEKEDRKQYLQEYLDDELSEENFFEDIQQVLQLPEDGEQYDLRCIENLLPYTNAQSPEHLATWLNFWDAIHDGYGYKAVCLHTELNPPIGDFNFRTCSHTILDQEGNKLSPRLERSFWEPCKKQRMWINETSEEEDAYRFFRLNYLSKFPDETRDYTIHDDPSLLLPYLL